MGFPFFVRVVCGGEFGDFVCGGCAKGKEGYGEVGCGCERKEV